MRAIRQFLKGAVSVSAVFLMSCTADLGLESASFSCAKNDDCASGYECSAGTCIRSEDVEEPDGGGGGCAGGCPLGSQCSAPSECASGFCVDGVCCNSACSGA